MVENSENAAKGYLLPAAERDAIHDEVNKYLNSTTRELLPNEERIIKKVAKGYNFFVLAVTGIIGSIGLIAGIKYVIHMEDTVTKQVTQQVLRNTESQLKGKLDEYNDLIKSETRKVGERMYNIEHDMGQDFNTFSKSIRDKQADLQGTVSEVSERIKTKGREADSSIAKLVKTKDEAAEEITKVAEEITKVINTRDEARQNIEEVKKLLPSIQQLVENKGPYEKLLNNIKESEDWELGIKDYPEKNQYRFVVGELQVIWGLGKTEHSDKWTHVDFAKPFADPKRVFVSVSSAFPGVKADEYAFVETSNITQDGFNCKLIRRRLLAHEIQKDQEFKFLAIGQIKLKKKVSESTH